MTTFAFYHDQQGPQDKSQRILGVFGVKGERQTAVDHPAQENHQHALKQSWNVFADLASQRFNNQYKQRHQSSKYQLQANDTVVV